MRWFWHLNIFWQAVPFKKTEGIILTYSGGRENRTIFKFSVSKVPLYSWRFGTENQSHGLNSVLMLRKADMRKPPFLNRHALHVTSRLALAALEIKITFLLICSSLQCKIQQEQKAGTRLFLGHTPLDLLVKCQLQSCYSWLECVSHKKTWPDIQFIGLALGHLEDGQIFHRWCILQLEVFKKPWIRNQYFQRTSIQIFCDILGISLSNKFSKSYVQFAETSNQEISLIKMLYFDNKSITVKIGNWMRGSWDSGLQYRVLQNKVICYMKEILYQVIKLLTLH